MKNTKELGKLISLEGMDGCGKSSALIYLKDKFLERNIPSISTYEVGGTPIGKQLRAIAFNKQEEVLDPLSRLLLMYAARIQHIRRVIEPAILSGTHVLTDRYNDSTKVYQGKIDGLEKQMAQIEASTPMRMVAVNADIVIYFKVDTERAYSRGKARSNVDNTQYKTDLELANKINMHYDQILMQRMNDAPGSVFVVDANKSQEEVYKQLDQFVIMFENYINLGK